MNFFVYRPAAERYAKGRPYFHPQVISRIGAYLSITKPVARAVDVACGTGLSTVALKELAEHIVGVDSSPEMVTLAPRDARIAYVISPAEKLPLPRNSVDLMTISQAFHWTSRSEFLAEARRVLHDQAWLIVYDNYFSGEMEENEGFQRWVEEAYNQEYPSPLRPSVTFGKEDAQKEGFQFVGQETYANSTKFSLEGLVNYLMTHTNVIAAVEGGNKRNGDARRWLTQGITPFYEHGAEATVRFNAPIWYLRKVAAQLGAG